MQPNFSRSMLAVITRRCFVLVYIDTLPYYIIIYSHSLMMLRSCHSNKNCREHGEHIRLYQRNQHI